MPTLDWNEKDFELNLLDQRVLPREVQYIACQDYTAVADAIRTMVCSRRPGDWCLPRLMAWRWQQVKSHKQQPVIAPKRTKRSRGCPDGQLDPPLSIWHGRFSGCKKLG